MKDFANWCRRYISVVVLIVIGVLIYMVFFSDNSMSRVYAYNRTIDSLKHEIAVQTDTMKYYNRLNHELDNRNPEAIERVVRENFNMCREDEEVFICR
ncbi:MAG: septum formation initiator family protein [Muribaculaceae bacterium]